MNIELIAFFKALADPTRLRLVGLLAERERSVEELATLLNVRPPTVSHHLNRLKTVGLLSMRGDGTTHLYRLQTDALRELSRRALNIETLCALPDHAPQDAWDRKVLRDFLVGERLSTIPASRRKRDVVLHWLAERFDADRRYLEREVNAVLQRHHEDVATLRRELVGAQLLRRERGVYWRPAA